MVAFTLSLKAKGTNKLNYGITYFLIAYIDLFFSTQGGETCMMDAFISYLNLRHEEVIIHLTDAVASSGAFLLSDFKGKIVITDNVIVGMGSVVVKPIDMPGVYVGSPAKLRS